METDLGVSALEEGLEELFFRGEEELSLYTTLGKLSGISLIWSMLISLESPSSRTMLRYLLLFSAWSGAGGMTVPGWRY